MSRGHSGQAPLRSYSGLASLAPRTCPPWRLVSMPGARTGALLRPASAEMASPGPSQAQGWSLGLAQLESQCRKLKRKKGNGEVEEEREREGKKRRKGERWMLRDAARWME